MTLTVRKIFGQGEPLADTQEMWKVDPKKTKLVKDDPEINNVTKPREEDIVNSAFRNR